MCDLIATKGPLEFDFVKSAFTMKSGGIYLVQIQHIKGPKIVLEPKKRRTRKTIE